MMRSAGIDIGSRNIKLVVLEGDRLVESLLADTGFDPLSTARELLDNLKYDTLLATGYGRGLLEVALDAQTVTEIMAHGRGARHLFCEARTILDIGGQDSKAIALNAQGKVVKFEMNDRCAAGTGKFLEIMARALGFSLARFAQEALAATKDIQINSMCTVFAESEVTSLVARGENRNEIAMGLHRSVARRAAAMVSRVAVEGPIIFTGGVALNTCLVQLLSQILKTPVLVPDDPQIVGALGAALLARERGRQNGKSPGSPTGPSQNTADRGCST